MALSCSAHFRDAVHAANSLTTSNSLCNDLAEAAEALDGKKNGPLLMSISSSFASSPPTCLRALCKLNPSFSPA